MKYSEKIKKLLLLVTDLNMLDIFTLLDASSNDFITLFKKGEVHHQVL